MQTSAQHALIGWIEINALVAKQRQTIQTGTSSAEISSRAGNERGISMKPSEAVKAFCRQCVGIDVGKRYRSTVEDCKGDTSPQGPCEFYPYRVGEERISVKVFRKFCLSCMGGNRNLVSECETEDCPCHLFRMGKNPNRAGTGNHNPNFTSKISKIDC